MHSRGYVRPEHYTGLHVLVIGGNFSATDLVIDLCRHGVRADISHRKPEPKLGLPAGVIQYNEPVLFEEDKVYFRGDDVGYRFDVIIFGTGYRYGGNLHFLAPECQVETDELPRPLHKFLINPKYPTMAILNQVGHVASFPLCEYQAIYFQKLLLGDIELGSYVDVLSQAWSLTKRKPGWALKRQYWLNLDQYEYNKSLATESGLEREPANDHAAHYQLYDIVGIDRLTNPSTFRNKEYEFDEETGVYKMTEDWN